MTVDDILIENQRRNAEINAPYNPREGCEPGVIDIPRCFRDFEYWAASCCYIKNKEGGDDILFLLNRPQRRMVRILETMRTQNKPIRLILLKARQWGGSTCAQLYMAWLQLVHKTGLNSLIVAHQHAATSEIQNMFIRMIDRYPDKLFEAIETSTSLGKNVTKRTERAGPGAIRVLAANCTVKVASAERPDSCRGGDYSLVHCSEVALWKKTKLRTPEDMLRSACSGVLLRPLTMIVLESTANGTGNFFHTEYKAAKNGRSQFSPLFVPWYEIDKYTVALDDNEKERFARWLLQGKDNDQPEDERSQPGKYLWWLWEKGATLEALKWYVMERRKYSDHADMAAEYPSDDIEAFAHSGARVFDKYKIDAMRENCKSAPKRGEISGDSPSGPQSLQNLKFYEDGQGALKVWKLPPGIREDTVTDRYVAVVDIGGRSIKADWSVIAVLDRGPMAIGQPPEIVAQWRGHTDFDLLAWNAARIAKFYSDALLVVESNTLETRDRDRHVEGDQSLFLLEQIRKVYANLYARKRTPDDIRQGLPVKYGFHTNVLTKPLIIANLVKVVREGLYVERDEMCLDEFATYEQRPDGSYGAISGKHDDLLMTRAIALYVALNEMPAPQRKSQGDYNSYYRQPRGSYASF